MSLITENEPIDNNINSNGDITPKEHYFTIKKNKEMKKNKEAKKNFKKSLFEFSITED